MNPVGHPVPHKQSHQYAEPPRGTQDWLSWKYREELRTPKYWTKYTSRNTLKDWNLDVRTHFHSLQPVDQVVSNSIAAAFKSTMSSSTIKSIQRVENVDLFQKYAEECQRLFRKAYVEGNFVPLDKIKSSKGPVKVMKNLHPSITQYTYPEINEYYFFHGTNAQHVDAICSQGLDSRLANSGRLGSGVYGAEVASKSASYVGKRQFSYIFQTLLKDTTYYTCIQIFDFCTLFNCFFLVSNNVTSVRHNMKSQNVRCLYRKKIHNIL